MASAGQSQFAMNPTATSLLNAFQRVAHTGSGALKQLGSEIKANGRNFSSENVTLAIREAHQVRDYLKNDAADEDRVTALGAIFEEDGIAEAVSKMVFADPPVQEDESVVEHLLGRLHAFQAGDLDTAYGSAPVPPEPQSTSGSDPSSGMKANRRPVDPDDSAEAGLQLPVAESLAVKIYLLLAILTLAGYAGFRLWDVIVNIHQIEDEASLTVYRILIILAEVVYGLSSCSSIVSRTRRQRLEAMVRSKRDTPFVVDDILTLLIVTDEAAVTIIESARSHYAAAKPDLAFRVILVADTPGGAAAEAFQVLKEEHGNVLLFVKEELARQEYVMNVQDEELQAALNVVLEENMYLGQVLFYTLDRLFLQYGHAISNAAIVCMPASSVVDGEKYYPFSVAQLQQPGFAAVSTPTYTRNQSAATDFLDIGNYARERVNLTTLGADGKFALNSTAFMSRGYSLWRVLRRMEMENVDTAYLGWISYAMHIESRQATLCAMSAHAPITSVLAPTHPPTVLSQVLDRQAEGFDVALIFDRERPFLSWNLHNPMRAPHDAARVAVFFEATVLCVLLITTVGNIAPWSTHSLFVAGAFLVHYLGMMFFHLVTPYTPAVPALFAHVMRNRVLAPAHAWLYFLNLSRFGVDRRGHFRAVGETTTADLVTYKEKQREAKEDVMQKQKLKMSEAKEKAATDAAEKKTKQQQESVLKKRELERKKAEAAEAKAQKKAAEKQAKEREKLRRARRGPGMAMMEAHGSHDEIEVSVPAGVAEEAAAGPVAEGFFSKKKRSAQDPTTPSDTPPAEVDAASFASGGGNGSGNTSRSPSGEADKAKGKDKDNVKNKIKRDKRNLLPHTKPEKLEVPKFTVPAAKSRQRTGKGERHRPHRFVKGASIPIAVLLILASGLGIWISFDKVFGSQAPENYSMLEILAARSWTLSSGLLGLYIIIAALLYVSYIGRFAAVLANRVVASLLILLSFLVIAAIGALPFLSTSILDVRNTTYDLDELHRGHMEFISAMAAGPRYDGGAVSWRQASDVNIVAGNRSLAGGWYTGPGLSKFTYPQAIMLVDLSFAAIAHHEELRNMPGMLSGTSAADDLQAALIHGANYLLACHDPVANSVVALVASPNGLDANAGAEWIAPEQRSNANVVELTLSNPGTETFAAITAAFAALTVSLNVYGESELVAELRTRSNQTFTLMESAPVTSYEETLATAAVASFWPSAGGNELFDDMLLASALMLYSDGKEARYKNAVNGYYTRAQQARAARAREGDTGYGALEDFRLAVDDHWWMANVLLFHADALNSRYRLNLQRFVNAWEGELVYHQTIDTNLIRDRSSLMLSTPPTWASGQDPGYTTPGPLPMTVRAMSYVIVYAATQLEETDEDRAASCFAKGQLRHILGLNDDQFSYVVGMDFDGARFPRQPLVRPAAGPSSFNGGGSNPQVLRGALVNGPDVSGNYQDSRQRPEYNGVGVLNNAPLSLLIAGLRSRELDIEDCIGFKPRDSRRRTSAIVETGNNVN